MEVGLRKLVVAWVAGHDSAFKLTQHLYPSLTTNSYEFDQKRDELKGLTDNGDFASLVHRAEKDAYGTAVQHLKDSSLAYVLGLEAIAFGPKTEPNVKSQTLRSLAKLSNLEPSQKITFTSPQDYADKLDRDFGEEDTNGGNTGGKA